MMSVGDEVVCRIAGGLAEEYNAAWAGAKRAVG
jgi:hypothetical protein